MRIAIVGTSPSSRNLAPFGDGSWTIWGVGPGNLQPESRMPRCDVFFELHPFESIRSGPEAHTWVPYLNELRKVPKVYTQKVEMDLPQSVEYPLQEMVDRYGPYFFTSSFSYMVALAIKELLASPDQEKVIGFWGVDCSATEEYSQQRPGAQYFFMKAREAGIRVVCPPQSDLLLPPGFYGYCEADPYMQKMLARQNEYKAVYSQCMQIVQQQQEKALRVLGALDDIQYNVNTWANRQWMYQTPLSAPALPETPVKAKRVRKPRIVKEKLNGTDRSLSV